MTVTVGGRASERKRRVAGKHTASNRRKVPSSEMGSGPKHLLREVA